MRVSPLNSIDSGAETNAAVNACLKLVPEAEERRAAVCSTTSTPIAYRIVHDQEKPEAIGHLRVSSLSTYQVSRFALFSQAESFASSSSLLGLSRSFTHRKQL